MKVVWTFKLTLIRLHRAELQREYEKEGWGACLHTLTLVSAGGELFCLLNLLSVSKY